jgi:hypothetical protein
VSALPKKTAFSWPTHALKERMKKKFLTTATTRNEFLIKKKMFT